MPTINDSQSDVKVVIHVVTLQGSFVRTTTFDIELKDTNLAQHLAWRDRNASAPIELDHEGIHRCRQGLYTITVTPTDRFEPQSQFVNIPPSGFATVEFIFDRPSALSGPQITAFTANPTEVTKGQGITLFWTTNNAETVTISGIGNVPAAGTHPVTPAQTTTYTLTARNWVGEKSASVTVTVNQVVTPSNGSFIVTGLVTREGRPAPGARVQVIDVDFRRTDALGEATTNGEGKYSITYTADQFSRAEKLSADLLVRTVDSAQPSTSSLVHFPAPNGIDIPLELSPATRATPEFSEVQNAIQPLIGDVYPRDFTKHDMEFLSGETALHATRPTAQAFDVRLVGGR